MKEYICMNINIFCKRMKIIIHMHTYIKICVKLIKIDGTAQQTDKLLIMNYDMNIQVYLCMLYIIKCSDNEYYVYVIRILHGQ